MRKVLVVIWAIFIFTSACILSACTEKENNIQKSENTSTNDYNEQSEVIDNNNAEIEINADDAKKYLKENFDKINIDGSTSMIPLHQSLSDLFSSDKEEKSVIHSKTVDAFDKLIFGENDILLGVDYSDELLEKAKANGIDLVKLEITREAFVFLININNPVRSLTVEQLKNIYSGKITNWSEMGGDDAPINAYQRNSDSGSQMRMVKFMGDTKLMDKDVEYWSSMGYVVEQIGNYDEGRYSIAYNMYTFTEKQYPNNQVILLDVNGVHPNDETIFDETYPIVIYNYIYYDKNNAAAHAFAENLYAYLMSGEGQKLISDSGYVNLNQKLGRNKDIEPPYDWSTDSGLASIGFYNELTGEFYWENNGELIIYNNFPDYVLRDSKYKDNQNARDFLTVIFDSDIPKNPSTAQLWEERGAVSIGPWFGGGVLDPEHFFNLRYNNKYYYYFRYYIDEDKYVLESIDKDTFESYAENGYLDGFSDYTDNYVTDAYLEITKDDLKNLYLRTFEINQTESGYELNFFQPFK